MWNDDDFVREDPLWANEQEFEASYASCMTNVFIRMCLALMVTTISALLVATQPILQEMIFASQTSFYIILIAPIILVIAINWGINHMPSFLANILFFIYAFLIGLTLSFIFFVYELGTIFAAFGVTSVTFGVMAGYGLVTKKDLSTVGSICFMGLIGIIIASVANFFLRNSALEWIVTYVGVLVFVGLTAYDAQRIKVMLQESSAYDQDEAVKKITVRGALTLYLDFINLFLYILKIMGRRR